MKIKIYLSIIFVFLLSIPIFSDSGDDSVTEDDFWAFVNSDDAAKEKFLSGLLDLSLFEKSVMHASVIETSYENKGFKEKNIDIPAVIRLFRPFGNIKKNTGPGDILDQFGYPLSIAVIHWDKYGWEDISVPGLPVLNSFTIIKYSNITFLFDIEENLMRILISDSDFINSYSAASSSDINSERNRGDKIKNSDFLQKAILLFGLDIISMHAPYEFNADGQFFEFLYLEKEKARLVFLEGRKPFMVILF